MNYHSSGECYRGPQAKAFKELWNRRNNFRPVPSRVYDNIRHRTNTAQWVVLYLMCPQIRKCCKILIKNTFYVPKNLFPTHDLARQVTYTKNLPAVLTGGFFRTPFLCESHFLSPLTKYCCPIDSLFKVFVKTSLNPRHCLIKVLTNWQAPFSPVLWLLYIKLMPLIRVKSSSHH